MLYLLLATSLLTASGFMPTTPVRMQRNSYDLKMQERGAGFNYDPSNYKDSNDGNYRRLSDQMSAIKAEEDKLKREAEEIIRKEQMAKMFLKKENETFWTTPGDTVVATSDPLQQDNIISMA